MLVPAFRNIAKPSSTARARAALFPITICASFSPRQPLMRDFPASVNRTSRRAKELGLFYRVDIYI
jgi:hypothetical protein